MNREGSNFCNRCGTALHDRAQVERGQIDEAQDGSPELTDRTETDRVYSDLSPEESADERYPLHESAEIDHAEYNPARSTPTHAESAPAEPPTAAYSTTDTAATTPPQRLIRSTPSMLAPIGLASNVNPDELASIGQFQPPLTVPAAQLRRIRTLVTEDPVLVEYVPPSAGLPPTRFRLPWLIVLLLLAVAIPLLLLLTEPQGEPRLWTGVREAHAILGDLPENANVWILWAYDPATAGEMDLVMRPVAEHLIEQRTRVQVISLLPTGLATAQRLWYSSAVLLEESNQLAAPFDPTTYLEGGFLPGGAPALALFAKSPASALVGHTAESAALQSIYQSRSLNNLPLNNPDLAIVVAAQAEDVQYWLELVQPMVYTPVVAVTAAGADPVLRPYLSSNQLSGLVSGFDGAIQYQRLRGQRLTAREVARTAEQLVAQNWGHVALLLILVLGNLSALWRPSRVNPAAATDEYAGKGGTGSRG